MVVITLISPIVISCAFMELILILSEIKNTLLHFDQKSNGRIVGFSTLPCHMYDTMIFFLSVGGVLSVIRHLTNPSVKRHLSLLLVICKRRLSDMKNRRLSNGDKEEESIKRHK